MNTNTETENTKTSDCNCGGMETVLEDCQCQEEVITLQTDLSLLHTKVEIDTSEEIIRMLCNGALKKNYITELFIEKITEREKEFPTGLATAVPIAIPHIHDGCLKSFFSMATFAKPVIFEAMDGSEEDVKTEMVFLFGITDPSQQCAVLMKFCELFQNVSLMESIRDAKDTEELVQLLRTALGEYLVI